MKRWLAILTSLLLAISYTIPALADGTPTPTETPKEFPAEFTFLIGMNAYWKTSVYNGEYIQCHTIEGQTYIIEGPTAPNVTFQTITTRDITCLGQIEWTEYFGPYGSHWTSKGEIGFQIGTTDKAYYDYNYQSNGTVDDNTPNYEAATGSITGTSYSPGIFEKNYYDAWVAPDVDDNPGCLDCVINSPRLEQYFYIHVSGKPSCSTKWQTDQPVGSGTIDATNESGVPETLVVDQEYRLKVWGGPWNDGSADREDTAVKIDDHAWESLDQFAEDNNSSVQCTEGDPLDPTVVIVVFKATDVDWRIRVNDLAGEFGDNSGGMDFELDSVIPVNPTGCDKQFLRGAEVGSGTIPATLSAGVAVPNNPALFPGWIAGGWIEIITYGGPWTHGVSQDDHYDVAIKNPDDTWTELSADTYTACHTDNGNYVDAWYQLPNAGPIHLRVNDTEDTWSTNMGEMDYVVYLTNYSPIPPGGCAANYQMGDLIKVVTVPANKKDGVAVGDLPISKTQVKEDQTLYPYYAIETSLTWDDNGTPETWPGMENDIDNHWYDLQSYPTVTCAYPLDPVGHMIVFVPVDDKATHYLFRVQDSLDQNYDNNSGNLDFTIYKALSLIPNGYTPGPMPGPGICDPFYSKGDPEPAKTIYANNESGEALGTLTSSKIYAIETSGGPWKNDGTDSYEVAISEDGGTSWSNLPAWTHSVCAQSDDGDHILVYFQALAGRNYKVRVYDPGGLYSDNTESIDYLLYKNVTIINNGDCSSNYNLSSMAVADNRIPRNNPTGVAIPEILTNEAGTLYGIEIKSDPYWNYTATPDDHRYDAQISKDNGGTWEDFSTDFSLASCVVLLNTPTNGYNSIYKIIFAVPAGGSFAMRINNSGASAGHLEFILYSAENKECTGSDCNANPIPPDWQAECLENYPRPGYLFTWAAFQIPSLSLPSINFGSIGTVVLPTISFPSFPLPVPAVGDWIAYLQWTVRSFFAWCPIHTSTLLAMSGSLNNYDPFGTINEFIVAAKKLDDDINSLFSGGGENNQYAPHSIIFGSGGGENGESITAQSLLPSITNDSPWAWSGSGPLVNPPGTDVHFSFDNYTGSGGGEIMPSDTAQYTEYCGVIFSPHFGNATGTAICSIIQLGRSLPLLWILIQCFVDVGTIWAFVKYIKKTWINPLMDLGI